MDRVVRFSLFSLSALIGSLFMIVASQSEEDEVALAEGGHEAGVPGEEVSRLGAQRSENEIREAASEPVEEPDWAALEILQRARSERRVATMTAAAAREPIDPEWGPATEQKISERFAAEAPVGFELLSATCKTTLCVAEIQSASRKQSAEQLAWSEFLGLSRGFVHRRADQGDGSRTVVFLAREGHSLPK